MKFCSIKHLENATETTYRRKNSNIVNPFCHEELKLLVTAKVSMSKSLTLNHTSLGWCLYVTELFPLPSTKLGY